MINDSRICGPAKVVDVDHSRRQRRQQTGDEQDAPCAEFRARLDALRLIQLQIIASPPFVQVRQDDAIDID